MKSLRIFCAATLSAIVFLAVYAQAADKEKIIYQFVRASGGRGPAGGLYQDQSGNLFGLTDSALFYELSPNGSGGWSYSALAASDCYFPPGPLVRDQAGNFYNASNNGGSVCEFSPNGSGGWSSSVIYTFSDGPSGLLIDAAGNLYGIEGNGVNGFGYVFELSPTSGGAWSLTDLYDFTGTDGNASSGVSAGLIMDASGNLYGVTWAGGSGTTCTLMCGVVFELTNNSGVWTETVLHNFNGTDGINPAAPLLMDNAGNLYGTTTTGGASGVGTVFEISAPSAEFRVIHSFTNQSGDGAYPSTALIIDAAGNLYGTTEIGGLRGDCSVGSIQGGCGTAFELSPVGNRWKESLLHDFGGIGDGTSPSAFVLGANGALYGVSPAGGSNVAPDAGMVFEIVP